MVAGSSRKSAKSPSPGFGGWRRLSGVSLAPGLCLAILLILLHADLASGFTILAVPHLLACLAVALVLALLVVKRTKTTLLRVLLLSGAALAVGEIAVSLSHQIQSRSLLESSSSLATHRLEARAGKIQREFQDFLTSLSSPAHSLDQSFPEDRSARFARLAGYLAALTQGTDRFGWTLWHDRFPDAWAGRTALSQPGTSPGIAIEGSGASLLLVASTPIREGWILTSEYLLQSPLESSPFLPLPSIRSGGDGDRVQVGSLSPVPPPVESPDLDSLRTGRARHGAITDLSTLYLPLKSDEGQTLLVLTLRESPREALALRLRNTHQIFGIALSGLVLLALSQLCLRAALRREGAVAGIPFAFGFILLITTRLVLFPLGRLLDNRDLFGSRLFGYGFAAPLFSSPWDCFATALVGSLMAGWIGKGLRDHRGDPRRRAFGLSFAIPLIVLSAYALLHFARRAPWDSRFEITRVVFFPPDLPRLLVQSSLCLMFGSWLFLLVGCTRYFLGRLPATHSSARFRRFGPARSLALVALCVLLFLPVLLRESTRQREQFFAGTLLPEVETQEAHRERVLEEILEEISESPQAKRILQAAESESGEGTAYRLWATTRLRREGFSSALKLFAPDGRLLGRFGLNLPAEPRFDPAGRGREGRVEHLLLTMGGLRRRVLAGEVVLEGLRGVAYRVQIYLLDESENLSFIRSENPDVRLFQAILPSQTNPELISSEPLLAAFDARGRLIQCNLEGGASLPPGILGHLHPAQSRWTVAQVGDELYRALATRSGEGYVILGFPIRSALQVMGSFVRFALLCLLLGSLAGGALALLDGRGFRRVLPPGGLFRRLLWVFLSASLVPLFALSLFLHQLATRESQEDLLSQGLTTLGAAGRILEDYLHASDPDSGEPVIDDGIAYWISRVVDQDINLYRGEKLSSSSTRELYSSGLLFTRLEASIYRQLVMDGHPYALSRRAPGSLDSLTISAPLSPTNPGAAILSLPLSVKEREIRHKRADADEAILIVTVLMLFLLLELSDYMARRVSRPIAALSAAADRIEAGDFDAEVRVPAKDETALLIESFNRMAASLRKQREDLSRRGDYIAKILLNATTGVISTDPAERIVTLTPAARLLLGLDAAADSGSSLPHLLSASAALGPLSRALAESPPDREARWQLELALGERPSTLRVASLPFRETPDAPAGRILLLEDISEAIRSSRLEAWADMARRIAHEIKNPLTPIQLSADHLRKVYRTADARFSEILEQCLDTIQKQVRALRTIAGDFSDYARIRALSPQRISARSLLEDVLAPYRDNSPAGMSFALELDPSIPDLHVDPELTRRALVNLIQNSLEAMGETGTVTLSAAPIPASEDGSRARVRIRVTDDGAGMDAATQGRLFEPYFSTKATGSGLGLSIVKKTVEDQGGRIKVLSHPGRGTEVILDLPAWEA